MYIDPRAAPRGGARRAGGDAEAVRADLAEELVDHECEDLRGESKRSSAAPVPRSTGGVCSRLARRRGRAERGSCQRASGGSGAARP